METKTRKGSGFDAKARPARSKFVSGLHFALACKVREWKQDGTTGMGFDCFAQNAATIAGRLHHLEGAPRGTSAQWMFHQVLKDILREDATLRAFVSGVGL